MWAPQVEALEAAGHRVARARPARLRRRRARRRRRSTTWSSRRGCSTSRPPSSAARSAAGLRSSWPPRSPKLVTKLVLVAPGLASTEWSEEAQAGFAEEEALIESGDLAGAAEQQARMWLAPDASTDVRELTVAMTVRSYDQQLPVRGRGASGLAGAVGGDAPGRARRADAARRRRRRPPRAAVARRTARARAAQTPGSRRSRAPATCRASNGPNELNRLLLEFLQ